MLPARKTELLPDSRRDLAYISALVSGALAGAGNEWSEVVREFEDARNYLSISAATRPGEDAPTVRIEFGVQDEQERRATGGLVARWSRTLARIEGLEIVLIDGEACDVPSFTARLVAYVELPAAVSESAVPEGD